MERKIFKKIDSESKTVKWLRTSGTRCFMVFIDVTVLALAPVILTLLLFGEEAMDNNKSLICVLLIMLYAIINFGVAILDVFKAREFNDTTIVKENNSIFILRTNFVTYEVGLMKNQMSDEEAYNYSVKNSHKLPTDEEINKVLEERPEGFSVIEYKDCKLIRETKNYYKFVGLKDGVPSKFKIYKVYSNISSIVEGVK